MKKIILLLLYVFLLKYMFKKLYHFIKRLITSPADTWKAIEASGCKNNIHREYIFPLVLAGTIAATFGSLFTQKLSLQNIISTLIFSFLSYCGGFYISVCLIKTYIKERFGNETDWNTLTHFTAYASTVVFVVNILIGIIPLPDMFFLRAFDLYTLFIVAQGSFLLKIKEKEQVEFVLSTSAFIVFCPIIIKYVIKFLMPGL